MIRTTLFLIKVPFKITLFSMSLTLFFRPRSILMSKTNVPSFIRGTEKMPGTKYKSIFIKSVKSCIQILRKVTSTLFKILNKTLNVFTFYLHSNLIPQKREKNNVISIHYFYEFE